MFFDSWSDFIAMGGYGFFVWLSYGISLAALALLIWQSKNEKKRIVANVKKRVAREKQLQKQPSAGIQ